MKKLSGIGTDISSWRYTVPKESEEKGAQIDMLISRDDRVINVCEMKFAVGKYQMTSTYSDYLRDRIELFKVKTKTKYSVIQTMVTTYGVAEGIHSGIVQQEVTMDDLFEE